MTGARSRQITGRRPGPVVVARHGPGPSVPLPAARRRMLVPMTPTSGGHGRRRAGIRPGRGPSSPSSRWAWASPDRSSTGRVPGSVSAAGIGDRRSRVQAGCRRQGTPVQQVQVAPGRSARTSNVTSARTGGLKELQGRPGALVPRRRARSGRGSSPTQRRPPRGPRAKHSRARRPGRAAVPVSAQ